MPINVPGSHLPGPFALARWMADPEGTFRRDFETYGDLYALTSPLFGRQVVLNHPDLIRQVFAGDTEVYFAGAANFALAPILGDLSVLMLDGSQHTRMRKLFLPAFTGERLAGYATVMRDATKRALRAWPKGTPISVLPSTQSITFDVILETVFGVHQDGAFDELRTRLLDLVERVQSPLGVLWLIPALQKDLGPLTGWAALKRSIDDADTCIYRIIDAARTTGRTDGKDVLSALLGVRDDAGAPLSPKELRDQLMTLLLAGHETTALSLAWSVDEIARRPDVLARIHAEIDKNEDGPMPYLDAAIKEVLRLHPVTPLLGRKLTQPINLRGYEIPAGTFVVPNVYNVQRHPAFWPDPDAFKPERFLDQKPDPYAWLPFGGGARRCIGMGFALLEMRVVLATMLREREIISHGPPAKLTLRSFLFAPKGGARVVTRARASTGAAVSVSSAPSAA